MMKKYFLECLLWDVLEHQFGVDNFNWIFESGNQVWDLDIWYRFECHQHVGYSQLVAKWERKSNMVNLEEYQYLWNGNSVLFLKELRIILKSIQWTRFQRNQRRKELHSKGNCELLLLQWHQLKSLKLCICFSKKLSVIVLEWAFAT